MSGTAEHGSDSDPLPTIDFATFILSLSHSALMHLGEAPHPETDKVEAKVGPNKNAGKANPEGINPKGVSSADPTAPSNGTTK